MNLFRQHIPTFVDGVTPEQFHFETTEELLAFEVVKSWGEDPGFSHFAISHNHLMAIRDDGFGWYVIGYLKDPSTVDLPKWEGGKYRALLDGKEVVLTKEVYSSCGDVLTLYDGRTAKDLRY